MLKKEWLLMGVSVIATLLLALGLVRWFAPQLLGIPVDLQLVKVQKEVPPFFDNIFQNILGFRNRQVPNIADIITIGDSQTYGNNAPLEFNWPSYLARVLSDNTTKLYNMSLGGWGATQYLDIFDKAVYLQPFVVIVAYYTGNDPLDSFAQVYGNERWQTWRSDKNITAADAPRVSDNKSNQWQVSFTKGFRTSFTPALRYLSNKYDNPVVRLGYDIMARSAEEIAAKAQLNNIKIIFTIIPTKEYVYAKKIQVENINPREDYSLLIQDEQKNINHLATRLNKISGATYVDLPSRLQEEAVHNPNLYQDTENGHPNPPGYRFIAKVIEPYVRKFLHKKPSGLVVVLDNDQQKLYYIIHNDKIWAFGSKEILEGNGWDSKRAISISKRFIDNLPYAGYIFSINPKSNGPNSLKFK